jgi:acylphosphatase
MLSGTRIVIWPEAAQGMNKVRMQIFYSGRVQGVGFRYLVKSLVAGYEVTGFVRNLPDGRVELVAEGERGELEAFGQGIRESGIGPLIRDEATFWLSASKEFCGFEILK